MIWRHSISRSLFSCSSSAVYMCRRLRTIACNLMQFKRCVLLSIPYAHKWLLAKIVAARLQTLSLSVLLQHICLPVIFLFWVRRRRHRVAISWDRCVSPPSPQNGLYREVGRDKSGVVAELVCPTVQQAQRFHAFPTIRPLQVNDRLPGGLDNAGHLGFRFGVWL